MLRKTLIALAGAVAIGAAALSPNFASARGGHGGGGGGYYGYVGMAGAGFGSAEPTPFGMLLHFSANKIIVAVVVLVYVIGSLIALSASMQ